MTSSEFEHLHAIQISVHTAELHFNHATASVTIQVSGSLVNIARGSCQLTIHSAATLPQSPCGALHISADRPVMKAQASIYKDDFDRLQLALSQPSQPRPATFVISLTEPVTVNLQGILFITADTEIAIAEMNALIPLK